MTTSSYLTAQASTTAKASPAERAEDTWLEGPFTHIIPKPTFFLCFRQSLRAQRPCTEHCTGAECAKCGCIPAPCSRGFAFLSCIPGCRHPPSQLQLCKGNWPLPPARPLCPLLLLRPANGEEGQGAQAGDRQLWKRGQHAAAAAQHPAGRARASAASTFRRAATLYLVVQFISFPDSKQIQESLILII